MSKEGGTPWPVWAAVTILVALIGVFGKRLVDHSESTANNAVVPFDAERWLTPRLGLYAGVATNRLHYAQGAMVLDLKSVEPDGQARADVEWSEGLSGAGSLVGTLRDSVFGMSGMIISITTGVWDSDVRVRFVSPDSIAGTYRLFPKPGNDNGTQDGEFALHRWRR
jgi:hypothetical protein